MNPGVLTLEEAADFLRVSSESVRRLAATHALPGRLIDGEWRFWWHAIVEWLSPSSPEHNKMKMAWHGHHRGEGLHQQVQPSATAKWSPEAEAEVEEFLAEIYAARRANQLPEVEGD